GAVTYLNTEALQVAGLEGDDTFNILAGTVPVFIDGGDPIGTTAGDRIVPFANGQPVLPQPGPENDEGGIVVGSNQRISFDHIEAITIVGSNCALIIGTNADDDITIIARDQSVIVPPAPIPLGLDGVRDFTTVVNNQMEILWVDTPEIHVDGLAGDDDVVL